MVLDRCDKETVSDAGDSTKGITKGVRVRLLLLKTQRPLFRGVTDVE